MNIQKIKNKANDKNSKKKYKDYHFDLFEKFLTYTNVTHKTVIVLEGQVNKNTTMKTTTVDATSSVQLFLDTFESAIIFIKIKFG